MFKAEEAYENFKPNTWYLVTTKRSPFRPIYYKGLKMPCSPTGNRYTFISRNDELIAESNSQLCNVGDIIRMELASDYEVDLIESSFPELLSGDYEDKWNYHSEIKGFNVSLYGEKEHTLKSNLRPSRNLAPTLIEAKAFEALKMLTHFRDIANCEPLGDWCDWKNNDPKYCIFPFKGEIRLDTSYAASFVLAFKTHELSAKFLKEFRPLIEIAKPIL